LAVLALWYGGHWPAIAAIDLCRVPPLPGTIALLPAVPALQSPAAHRLWRAKSRITLWAWKS